MGLSAHRNADFKKWSQNGHEGFFGQAEKVVKVEYGGYALIRTGDPIIMSDVL